jgi:hypothetical protein
MMVVGSLVELLAKPELFTGALKSLRRGSTQHPAVRPTIRSAHRAAAVDVVRRRADLQRARRLGHA